VPQRYGRSEPEAGFPSIRSRFTWIPIFLKCSLLDGARREIGCENGVNLLKP
jgi:hypothetical protein